MTGSAGSAVDVIGFAIAFFNRRVREEDRKRFCSTGGSADDGKRSKAEWTLCGDGIEERGVPGGEGTAITPDTPGPEAGGLVKISSKNGTSFYMIWGTILGVKSGVKVDLKFE